LTKLDSVAVVISLSLGEAYQPRSGLGKSAVVLLKVAEVVGPEVTTAEVEPLVVVVVVVGVVVVAVLAELSFQQTLFSPGAGSPKLALLQSTELANDFTTEAVVVPYLTLCVPLNAQVPYSCAHKVHACAVADTIVPVVLVVPVDALDASALAAVPPDPPPQAAKTMDAAAMTWDSNARRERRERETRSIIGML
jgi:hypothetical protein